MNTSPHPKSQVKLLSGEGRKQSAASQQAAKGLPLPVKNPASEITLEQSLHALSEISHVINQKDHPEQALDQILQSCIDSTGADSGSIMLLAKQKDHLSLWASRGLSPKAKDFTLPLGDGVTGWVAQHGKSRIVHDAAKERDYVSLAQDLFSELAVPMLAKGEIIGVLSVDAKRKHAFSCAQEKFLSIMANLAAGIFVNLRDNQLLKLRDRFHGVMTEISKLISQPLHLRDVFNEIMKVAEKAFRLHHSTLLLYNRDKERLDIAAASHLRQAETSRTNSDQALKKIHYEPGEGITGQVFLNKKAIFIPNVRAEPAFLNRMRLQIEEDLGFFCTPIFSGNAVVGIFSAYTLPQSGIDPSFILEFLEVVASYLSQAITIQKLVEDETQVIRFENTQLKQELSQKYEFGQVIARSAIMRKICERVRIVAQTRASVLITGESGTGKELIASALHYNSPRQNAPFIKLNCAAIPEQLLESELFGHRKGAFTGALHHKKGKFEMAEGGTIFLDEIGEMPLNMQSKLLRVLQEREIEPVGGTTRSIDIRILAASNADLEQKIKERQFRSDLYYRLNVIHLPIPPLRARKEDILPLVQHFIEKHAKENNRSIRLIRPEAVRLLEQYSWPGNVRQLENSIERAVILSQKDALDAGDFACLLESQLHEELVFTEGSGTEDREGPARTGQAGLEALSSQAAGKVYEHAIQNVERTLITQALHKFRYTKAKAARYLGINRNTLDKKIRELKIES